MASGRLVFLPFKYATELRKEAGSSFLGFECVVWFSCTLRGRLGRSVWCRASASGSAGVYPYRRRQVSPAVVRNDLWRLSGALMTLERGLMICL
jgi:hypothetical protein